MNNEQKETTGDGSMAAYDKLWMLLMVVAIAMSDTQDKPWCVIQSTVCGISLGIKIAKNFLVRKTPNL